MKYLGIFLMLAVLCTGCSVEEKSGREETAAASFQAIENPEGSDRGEDGNGYYENYATNSTEDSFRLYGTIHQGTTDRGLVRMEAVSGVEITVQGKLTRQEGELQLVYEDEDGTTVILAEGSADSGEAVSVDAVIQSETGKGKIYFKGPDAVYEFELELTLSEEIKYYLLSRGSEE